MKTHKSNKQKLISFNSKDTKKGLRRPWSSQTRLSEVPTQNINY